MSEHAPLIAWTLAHEQTRPDDLFLRYLEGGDVGRARLTSYAELAASMRRVAAAVQEHTSPGDRVLMLFPPGPEFPGAFLGTLLAHCIAVPAYTPDPTRLARTLSRLRAIIADSGCTLVLTTRMVVDQAQPLLAFAADLGALKWLAVDDLPDGLGADRSFEPPPSDAVAYLQYTSGSTSAPRGVVLTHDNVRANMDDLFALRRRPLRHNVSWLPVHHDMGLTMALCGPLHEGVGSTLLSPLDFIRRPSCWLEAVSHFGADTTGGPTFGFALAARKTSDETVATLDLSGLDTAIVSAEHIRPAAMDAFVDRFAPAGFSRAAINAAYGLAEVTVIATLGRDGPFARRYDPEALRQGTAVPEVAGELHLSSGVTGDTAAVVVVGGASAPQRTVGEIWLHGPSIGSGYWRNPAATEETFGARLPGDPRRWLRTGDLGFLDEGQLFVTGRAKDLIVVAGSNLHPHDVEEVLETAHPACRPGNGAAFPWRHGGEEQLGVAVEIDPRKGAPEEVMVEVRRVLSELGVAPAIVALLPKNTLPKTSSGKRQRRRTAERLQSGELTTLERWEPAHTGSLEELLGRFQLDGEGDFFARGGQSIDLVRLADQLSERFGVDVPLPALFADPTVDGVRRALQRADRSDVTADPALPSPAENRMLALYELAGAALHLHHVEDVIGPLDVDRLQSAVDAVGARHPALRTAWRRTADGVRIEGAADPVAVETVADFPTSFAERLATPFDLATGPLARVVVAPTPAGATIGWIWPHPVADGLSAERIVRDVWRAWAGVPLVPRVRRAPRTQVGHPAWWAEQLDEVHATRMTTPDAPDVPPYVGRSTDVPLDADIVHRLLALGAEAGCTPSMTWLAWFLVAVHDWVDLEVVRIGTPVVRPRREPDDVGCFVDVQLVVSRCDATTTFREHLANVKRTVLEGLAHPTPVADVLAALRTGGPAVDVLFNHLQPMLPALDTGLQHSARAVPVRHAALGVTLDVVDGTERTLRLTTADATVDPVAVPLLVDLLRRRLEAVVAAPDAALSQLPDPGDRWSGPAIPVPTIPLVGPLLDRDPSALAVIDAREHTAGELVDAARRVAAALVASGHRAGDPVIVDLPRSFDQVAAHVGIRLADGCIVPLSPNAPAARRDRIRAEVDTPFVIDADWTPVDATYRPRTPRPDALAYRLYTSGSTGRPMPVGVAVSGLLHRLVGGLAVFPPLAPDDRFAQKSSPDFGDALSEVWQPLWTGHPLVVVPEDVVQRPAAFLAALEQHRVTRMVVVPSLLRVLVDLGLTGRLADLRVLVSSGETLPTPLARRVRAALPQVALFNLYGTSETSLDVTAHAVDAGPVVLGHPLPNVHLAIVDRHGRSRPRGLVGELWVGGPFVSPELPDPTRTPTADGLRWFATRDRVHIGPAGLVGHGRMGDFVKVHGARVDTHEVRTALEALTGVEAAVVGLRDDRLTAWLTGATWTPARLREMLVDRLPQPSIPTVVVNLPHLPLLASGKVDRAALPDGTTALQAHTPPEGPLEERIAAIWQDVLGVDAVGRHADFYDLGGQSVAAMAIGARLEAELGRPVPSATLLRTSTIATLAAHLTAAETPPDDLELQPDGPAPPLFLLYGVAGTTVRMASVARHLRGRRQVIGLEAMSLRVATPPHRRVEEAARTLARRIMARQPTGPLLLGGYSFGGVLAFATAQELERRGRQVAGVYLLDSRAPATTSGRTRLRQRLRYTRMRLAVEVERRRKRLGGDGLDPSRHTKDANFTAWSRYRPTPWSGRVTWLRTAVDGAFPTGEWSAVAANLSEIALEGDHETCIRDPLAERVADRLDAAIRADLGLSS